MTDPRIIVALDVATPAEAIDLVDRLGDSVSFYKVGMELYAAAGMGLARELLSGGKRVFLDLKFHDIGETVRRAVAVVAQSGVHLLTVHAVGQVVRAAVEGRGDSPLKLLGVTVLTSLTEADLAEDGHHESPPELVERRARIALTAGIDGLVCSPQEVARIAKLAKPGTLLVTPGVRSAGADAGDQKRIATPAQALADGATHLVIGRQITRSPDPKAEALRILSEIRPAELA